MNWVRVGIFDGIKPLLTNYFGISQLTMQTEISSVFFSMEHPDTKCPLIEACQMLELCAHHTGCDHFGVLLAHHQKQSTELLGIVALVGQHSGTLREALAQTIRHQQHNASGVEWTLNKEAHYAHLMVSINEKTSLSLRQGYIYTMAIVFNLFTSITDHKWQPAQVCFSFPRPNNLTPWRQFFGKNLFFDMEYNGFIFEESQLTLDVSQKNQKLLSIINDYMTLSGQSPSVNKIEHIKTRMRSLLLLNQSCSLQQIAESQNKSVRTVQYYLHKHGFTYQQLLDEVRYSVAKELLSLSEHSISHIATMVGFSDSAVFSRSFKHHVGQTPSQYRKASFS